MSFKKYYLYKNYFKQFVQQSTTTEKQKRHLFTSFASNLELILKILTFYLVLRKLKISNQKLS